MERSRLYGLLATVFRHEPSAEFLCQMKTPEMMVALAGAGVELGEEFETDRFADISEKLGIEYTRLFLGPGKHISPHESVQLKRGSGILWGPETSAVRKTYRAAGLDLGENETVLPDHLSVELDFLVLLAKEEAEAWEKLEYDSTARSLHLQHGFISRHLGKWVGGFCKKVKEQADFAFYPAFAELLRGFLSGEKSEIISRLNLIDANDPLFSDDGESNNLRSING